MRTQVPMSESNEPKSLPITVVIPAYNEEAGLANTVADVKQALEAASVEYEIVVVNDGSTDGTANVAAKLEGVRVINHQRNLGYGGALKTGIRQAKYDLIVTTDADNTFPAEGILKLLDGADDADMAVGCRTACDARVPGVRKPAKWVLTKLANYLSGTEIPDINSGLRLFKRADVLRFFNLLPDGFSFSTTITLAMLSRGKQVKYVPVNCKLATGKSKWRPIRDTAKMLGLIWRTIMLFNPLKVFIPFALALLLLAVLVFFTSWKFLGAPLDTTSAILILCAVQVLVLGMIADLINKRSET